MEFKPFPKIERIGKLTMAITQKIHGTNAQVLIAPAIPYSIDTATGQEYFDETYIEVDGQKYFLRVGSRTRWISPEDDNFGFASFVYKNQEEFVRKLGVGQHFGEWAGPGINSGEGLKEKTFVLFDYWKYPPERPLPPQTVVVPVLYEGPIDLTKITAHMWDLKTNGSRLAPGFMRPEGVVVTLAGKRMKMVFEAEETQWKKGDGSKEKRRELTNQTDYSHLLQPIRLEKLLSRDEVHMLNYPQSLPTIVKEYMDDLVAEGQISGSAEEIAAIRKGAAPQVFGFVRAKFSQAGLNG